MSMPHIIQSPRFTNIENTDTVRQNGKRIEVMNKHSYQNKIEKL